MAFYSPAQAKILESVRQSGRAVVKMTTWIKGFWEKMLQQMYGRGAVFRVTWNVMTLLGNLNLESLWKDMSEKEDICENSVTHPLSYHCLHT